MKIWLIGGKGMLRSEVDNLLKEKRFTYLSTDLEVDIGDKDALNDFIKIKGQPIDWIINCSGYTAVDRAEEKPDVAFRVNAEGVLNIAKIAKSIRASLIHISTDYVFDGKKESGYLETDQTSPLGVYGQSKLEGENHIINTTADYILIRTSWLYGKQGTNFVSTMLILFNERVSVKVVSDQWGSTTYAVDLAQVILTILNTEYHQYDIYNFTNEGRTNWYSFAKEIYKLARKKKLVENDVDIIPITTKDYPTRAHVPRTLTYQKRRLKAPLIYLFGTGRKP